MKKTAGFLLCALFLFVLAGCGAAYQADDFIGKTSAQIEADFGAFDCCGMPAGEDGLYRNTACGYTIKAAQTAFLGTDPEVLFLIVFDENGIAAACKEGYRPGG